MSLMQWPMYGFFSYLGRCPEMTNLVGAPTTPMESHQESHARWHFGTPTGVALTSHDTWSTRMGI